MVLVKPHNKQRVLTSFISDLVWSNPFKPVWRLLGNNILRNPKNCLYTS